MSNISLFSDGYFIAVHALSYIKNSESLILAKDISNDLNLSYDHLSKILQKLEREEILISKRGPKGGFTLNKEKSNTSLFEILEIIDGKIKLYNCPFNKNSCKSSKCIIDNYLVKKTDEIVSYLKKTYIDNL